MTQNNKLGPRPVRGHQPIRGVSVTQAIRIQTSLGQRKHVQGGISPWILKIRSKGISKPLQPIFQIRKKEGNPKYLSKGCHRLIKCITTTLLTALMWRRPLNSATLATATHKELRKVSDGTGAQVGV